MSKTTQQDSVESGLKYTPFEFNIPPVSGEEHLEVDFNKWVRLWEEKERFRLREAQEHCLRYPTVIKNGIPKTKESKDETPSRENQTRMRHP